jgi:hypothetical protein
MNLIFCYFGFELENSTTSPLRRYVVNSEGLLMNSFSIPEDTNGKSEV